MSNVIFSHKAFYSRHQKYNTSTISPHLLMMSATNYPFPTNTFEISREDPNPPITTNGHNINPPPASFFTIHRRSLTLAFFLGITGLTTLALILSAVLSPDTVSSGISLQNQQQQQPEESQQSSLSTQAPTISASSSSSTSPKWRQIGPELHGDLKSYSEFGTSLSISNNGKHVAVGAPHHNRDRGMVTLYELTKRDKYHWTELNKFKGQRRGEYLGMAVALSADGMWLALGGNNESETGSVKIYAYEDDNWVQKGQEIGGASKGDDFGNNLEFSDDGKRLAVGSLAGYAQVFQLENDTWERLGDTIEGGAGVMDTVVALSSDGSKLAVGFPEDEFVKIYVFVGGWEMVGKEIKGLAEGDMYGISVDLVNNGNRVAIGTENGDYVEVYDYDEGTNEWGQVGDSIPADDLDESFGSVLSMSEDGQRLAIGSPYHSSGGNLQNGVIRIFEFRWEDWEPMGNDVHGKDDFGYAGYSMEMSEDGMFLAVGVPGSDRELGEDAGTAKVYQYLEGDDGSNL